LSVESRTRTNGDPQELLEHIRKQEKGIQSEIGLLRSRIERYPGKRSDSTNLVAAIFAAVLVALSIGFSLFGNISSLETLGIVFFSIGFALTAIATFYFLRLRRSQEYLFEMDKLLENYLSLYLRLDLLMKESSSSPSVLESLASRAKQIDEALNKIRSKASFLLR
jgi:hypothetical protein